MSRRKERQPLELENYKQEWLFGDVARAWLTAHPAHYLEEPKRFTRCVRAGHAVNDGWGLVVSYWKSRPDDQSCREVVCPKCKHTLQVNQVTWRMRHEKKCNLPTRSAICIALTTAFNVFSAGGASMWDVSLAQKLSRAFYFGSKETS